MELHLFETHNIRSDYIIEAAIKDGKRLGAKLDKNSIQKLDLEYSRYLDKEKEKTPPSSIHNITYEAVGGCQEGITQHTKNSFAFMPIISVDEFFKDDYNNPYSALPSHSLEQSPVAPIIGMKCAGRFGTMYYCEICHPEFLNDSTVSNINLSSKMPIFLGTWSSNNRIYNLCITIYVS